MKKGAFLVQPLTEEKTAKILDLGVNEISLKWEYCGGDHVETLREQGVKVYAEISLFVGEEMWQKYPDSRPVDRHGKPMEPHDWYYGVCPNHPGVRKEKLSIIDRILQEFNVDGLWLDFIRYPCHWEEVRSSPITEYCFCDHCLEKYERDVGGAPEGPQWISWKCDQITGFVREVHDRIVESGKPIQLGIFAVPWSENEYGGAIRSIIGQDFAAQSPYVDVFGVMAYHKIVDRPVEWIGEIVEVIDRTTGQSVVPLIQSMDDPEKVSSEEFERAIRIGMKEPSQGLIVFHFEDLSTQQDKFRALQRAFKPRSGLSSVRQLP